MGAERTVLRVVRGPLPGVARILKDLQVGGRQRGVVAGFDREEDLACSWEGEACVRQDLEEGPQEAYAEGEQRCAVEEGPWSRWEVPKEGEREEGKAQHPVDPGVEGHAELGEAEDAAEHCPGAEGVVGERLAEGVTDSPRVLEMERSGTEK